MKSEHAKAAAAIRKEIKTVNVNAKVRSESFSMGNAVRVTLYNPTPEQKEKIEKMTAKYQYGHFNGMEDIYEYSNGREDVPQVKFVTVEVEYSDELKQKAWNWIRENVGGFENATEDYNEAWNVYGADGMNGQNWVYRKLNGSLDKLRIA